MPEGLAEVVDQIAAAFNAGDPAALIAICDSDVEIDSRIARAGGRPFQGHDGVREWFEEIGETFDYFVVEIDELREAGDLALVLGRARWRGHGSGVETDEPLVWTAESDGGRLKRLAVYESEERAFAAFGEYKGRQR